MTKPKFFFVKTLYVRLFPVAVLLWLLLIVESFRKRSALGVILLIVLLANAWVITKFKADLRDGMDNTK